MNSLFQRYVLLALLIVLVLPAFAHAELVATGALGYHPAAAKQAISYTNATSGTFDVRRLDTNAIVYSGALAKAKDYAGNAVNCQGGVACLVADFTNFTTTGTYYVMTSIGGSSPSFTISIHAYDDAAPILLEFFDATLQQGSAYHDDIYGAADPIFNYMADGSPIMEADQAALSLIRLGSAYRRNPELLDTDKYDIVAPDLPDTVEHIRGYVEFLKDLQGVQIQERNDGVGFRLSTGMKIKNAFVPGPTNRTNLTIYIPGGAHTVLETVPVVSLCGADNGTPEWDACMDHAAYYYKCQADEPCLNITYIEETGTVISHDNGYGISKGWNYEFGCYIDVHLNETTFSTTQNPCAVFYRDTSRYYTTIALLGYAEAVPAIEAYSHDEATLLVQRSVKTAEYLKATYSYPSGTNEAGFYGAALFLLYDYTGNITYLQDAHAIRTNVSTGISTDRTRGQEYYWEEYARHKSAMTGAGLPYLMSGVDPVEYFRGKIFGDYKDRGTTLSIGRTAERVYQLDPNIQFHNSRFQLVEAAVAAKTADVYPSVEQFIPTVADYQLAWLTGQNAVQDGVAINSPLRSYSFIFGFGQQPTQYHSRYQIDTGYRTASNGQVVGGRGTGLQFNNGTEYVYLDGRFVILGQELGAMGNGYRNESVTPEFVLNPTYENGLTYIPGWISGAFDTTADTDVIYNYRDDLNTYEFTETTNEMVAIAIELLAYQDGVRNNRPRAELLLYNVSVIINTTTNQTNTTNTTGNQTNTTGNQSGCFTRVSDVPVQCVGGSLMSDTNGGCRIVTCASGPNSLTVMACNKPGDYQPQYFEMYPQSSSGSGVDVCIGGVCLNGNGYARSPDFPICINVTNSTGNQTNVTQNISIASSTPAGASVNIDEPQNQTFSITISNPDSLSTTITWRYDGVNQTSAFNQLSYTFLGNYSTNGTHDVLVTVQSPQNAASRLWALNIADTVIPNGTNQTNTTGNQTNSTGNQTSVTVCYNNLQTLPATCNGGIITSDTFNGGRAISCTQGANSLSISAWPKPDNTFEMYRQSSSGTAPKICLGSTCIQNNGFAKSGPFPICINTTNSTNTTGNQTNTTQNVSIASSTPAGASVNIAEPQNQTFSLTLSNPSSLPTTITWRYDGVNQTSAFNQLSYTFLGNYSTNGTHSVVATIASSQNTLTRIWTLIIADTVVTNGTNTTNSTNTTNTTGNVTLTIAPWFPQGRNVVLVCTAQNATQYDFYFGDGNQQLNYNQNNVWKTYAAAGTYNASCRARNAGGTVGTGSLLVTVA